MNTFSSMRCCGLNFQIILTDEPGEDQRSTHKCCTGSVHIKRAAMYVAISALILSAFDCVCLAVGVYAVNLLLDVTLLVLNTAVALLIFYGLYYEKAAFLLPFIVLQIAQCAGFFILAIYTLYFTIVYKKQSFYRKFDQILMVVSIFVGIVICGWATWVCAKCYNYLRQRNIYDVYFIPHRGFWR
uniref:MARVEL domain-containing protein n=1 Tax=Ascaris lumbricoides TaxID=6252 RepID=A0A0M3I7P0_ASCLU